MRFYFKYQPIQYSNMKNLKTILSFALFILLLSANQLNAQGPEVTLEFENAISAEQIVKNYINALQNGNVEAMNALLADDAMVYGLGGGKDSLNVAQHKEYYTNSTAQYIHSISRDLYLPVKVNNNWNEGEWILCWGTNTVTDKKSGKQIPIPYHTANKIDNGKIVKVYYYYDMLNIGQSQGFKLTKPN